ncbi:hypothetical protein [Stakelama saccharophila]|uniref:Transposase n=1 Tax=Stakelama saccharophila TaxID=3075605 RepID=A0ABZ0BFF2_9SPHN|nr:hypothetical protein [Stakelama sp. W311]WNO55224.1 hypothetical protein RPR59_14635 [Stakelama sp. W311]
MFEHVGFTHRRTKDSSGLLDDRGVGNDIDDPPQPVANGMVEREGETGQRLAAPGRYGHRE